MRAMSADTKSWSPARRRPADAGIDAAALLQGLGLEPAPAPREQRGAVTPLDAYEACCNFCWAAIPEGTTECPDCGASVAAMEEARAHTAEADGQWRPGAPERRKAPRNYALPNAEDPSKAE